MHFALIVLQASAQTPAAIPAPSKSDLCGMWGSEVAHAFGEGDPSYGAYKLFLDTAAKIASAMQAGLPIHLYRLDNRGGTTNEKFGLPIMKGSDSVLFGRPIVDNDLMEDAKDAVLSWYASQGIYAVNSTKRKKP